MDVHEIMNINQRQSRAVMFTDYFMGQVYLVAIRIVSWGCLKVLAT